MPIPDEMLLTPVHELPYAPDTNGGADWHPAKFPEYQKAQAERIEAVLTSTYAVPEAEHVRYVSRAGDDSNNGRTWGAAFRTVAAALADLPAGGGLIEIGGGPFSLSGGHDLGTPENVHLRGRGPATTLAATAAEWAVFAESSGGTASSIVIEKMTIANEGDAATASGTLRGGLNLVNYTNVVLRDLDFSGIANNHAIRVEGDATYTTENITIDGVHASDIFENNTEDKTSTSIVTVIGGAKRVNINDVSCVGATNPPDIGVRITALGTGESARLVDDINVTNCHFENLARFGIGFADDDPVDGSYRAGIMYVAGNTVRNCEEQGIKLKNMQRARVEGNYIDGCNTDPEDGSSSLVGGIFFNATTEVVCVGNIVLNDATDGIRCEGLAVGSSAGAGRSYRVIADNVVIGSTGAGIYLSQRCYHQTITGNMVAECGGQGIFVGVTGSPTTEQRPRSTVIADNEIRDTTSSGIHTLNADGTLITGNLIDTCATFGILSASGVGALIADNYVFDATTQAIRVTSTKTTVRDNELANVATTNTTHAIGIATATDCDCIENVIRDITNPFNGTPRFGSYIQAGQRVVSTGRPAFVNGIQLGTSATAPRIIWGAGDPEGAVDATEGSLYLRAGATGGSSSFTKTTPLGTLTGWAANH